MARFGVDELSASFCFVETGGTLGSIAGAARQVEPAALNGAAQGTNPKNDQSEPTPDDARSGLGVRLPRGKRRGI